MRHHSTVPLLNAISCLCTGKSQCMRWVNTGRNRRWPHRKHWPQRTPLCWWAIKWWPSQPQQLTKSLRLKSRLWRLWRRPVDQALSIYYSLALFWLWVVTASYCLFTQSCDSLALLEARTRPLFILCDPHESRFQYVICRTVSIKYFLDFISVSNDHFISC